MLISGHETSRRRRGRGDASAILEHASKRLARGTLKPTEEMLLPVSLVVTPPDDPAGPRHMGEVP